MMTATAKATETETAIRWLSDEEARADFDAQARLWLGISGEEFLRRWDAGEYRGLEDDDPPNVLMVASLISLVRP